MLILIRTDDMLIMCVLVFLILSIILRYDDDDV
jgi:hypothetical protein